MEKFVEITYLFDFYQELLTEKQRELITEYYFNDLSLGELATMYNISRQSIFDTIKKAQQKLIDYENKLQLWEKYKKQEEVLVRLTVVLVDAEKSLDDNGKQYISSIKELIDALTSEM
ncbi:MAG: sigma factor-like helix-turn-helix DNA-binding protein [Cellulosilyticaceae bacterium]